MVKRFGDIWAKKENEPSKTIANQGGIKDQITIVTQRLDAQTRSLDAATYRFQARDKEIFSRVVQAIAHHDEARANIYANELSEIRKVEKMITQASLALQSISMRLNTVSEMGDVVAALTPARAVLGSVKNEMCNIFPEASQELGNIGSLLSDICISTNQSSDMPTAGISPTEEALAILEDAEAEAEKRLDAQLPQINSESFVRRKASLET